MDLVRRFCIVISLCLVLALVVKGSGGSSLKNAEGGDRSRAFIAGYAAPFTPALSRGPFHLWSMAHAKRVAHSSSSVSFPTLLRNQRMIPAGSHRPRWRRASLASMQVLGSSDGDKGPTADETGRRLFVSKLSGKTDAQRLREAFNPFGELEDVKVVKPGLAYVTFIDVECASEALEKMQGVFVDGYEVGVRRARSYFIRLQQQQEVLGVQQQRAREAAQALAAMQQARSLDRKSWEDMRGGEEDEVDEEDEDEGFLQRRATADVLREGGTDPTKISRRVQEKMAEYKRQSRASMESPFGSPEGSRGVRGKLEPPSRGGSAPAPRGARSPFGAKSPFGFDEGQRGKREAWDNEDNDDDDQDEDEGEDVWADYHRDVDDIEDFDDDGTTAFDAEKEGPNWQDFRNEKLNDGWDDESDFVVPPSMKGENAKISPDSLLQALGGAGKIDQGKVSTNSPAQASRGRSPGPAGKSPDSGKGLLDAFMAMSDDEFNAQFSAQGQLDKSVSGDEDSFAPKVPAKQDLTKGAFPPKASSSGVMPKEVTAPPFDDILSMSDEEFNKFFKEDDLGMDLSSVEDAGVEFPSFGGSFDGDAIPSPPPVKRQPLVGAKPAPSPSTKAAVSPKPREIAKDKSSQASMFQQSQVVVRGRAGKKQIVEFKQSSGAESEPLESETDLSKNKAEIRGIEDLLNESEASQDIDDSISFPPPGMGKDMLAAMDISLEATKQAEAEAAQDLDEDDEDADDDLIPTALSEMPDLETILEQQARLLQDENEVEDEEDNVLKSDFLERQAKERKLLEDAAEKMLAGSEEGFKMLEALGKKKLDRKLMGNLNASEPRRARRSKVEFQEVMQEQNDAQAAYLDSVMTGWAPVDFIAELDVTDDEGSSQEAVQENLKLSTEESLDVEDVDDTLSSDVAASPGSSAISFANDAVSPPNDAVSPPNDLAVSPAGELGLSRESVVSVTLLGTLANMSSIHSMKSVEKVGGVGDMTYNALLQLLQGRIESRLEGLMTKVDEQAMAVRKDMILAQLTPEQITLNALLDVFENRIVPMRDLHARLGPRMKETRLHHGLSRRWWRVHERIRNDHRFRMSFVPSSVKKSWDNRKQVIRNGALDVESYLLSENGDDDSGDDLERRKRAADSWAKIKEESRLQKKGGKASTTLQRGTRSQASPSSPPLVNSKPGGKAKVSESTKGAVAAQGAVTAPHLGLQVGDVPRSSTPEPVQPASDRGMPATAGNKDRAQGAKGAAGIASSEWDSSSAAPRVELPVDESTSFAEIRALIKKDNLGIKTGGKSKVEVLKQMQKVWLQREG